MATRAEMYEEWAAEWVSRANARIRAGSDINDPRVGRDLDTSAALLSRANA